MPQRQPSTIKRIHNSVCWLLKRMEISRHEIRDWPLEDHAEIQIKQIGCAVV